MCAEETSAEQSPETNDTPSDVSQDSPKSGTVWSWPRRRFLQAAALGAAAAAFLNAEGGGITLGPLSAYANDLSTNPCTAQDVTVLGIGQVVNYCTCSASQTTFDAVVNFQVQNTASADRCCIGLHLVAGLVNGVAVVPAQDVVLKNITSGPDFGTTCIPGKSTVTMQGTITGFPCNDTAIVTFGTGTCGAITTGKCAPGSCSTVAWNTNTASANCTSLDQSPPGGQCRHETICVQGFGVKLLCSAGCPATCGGQITLQLIGDGGQTPYSFSLTDTSGNSYTASSTTTTTATYNISLSSATTFTGKITDNSGCTKQAPQLTETVQAISLTLTNNTPDCSGNVTFTATPSTTGTFTYAWTVDGVSVGSNSSTYAYPPNTDCKAHTVAVTATSSLGCKASGSKSITQTVSTTIA